MISKEYIEETRDKLKELEPDITKITNSIQKEDVTNLDPHWAYLQERRLIEAGRIFKDYHNLLGELNYLLNRCGPDIDVHKK